MEELLRRSLKELIDVLNQFQETDLRKVLDASNVIAEAMKRGNKLLICGNGGSAADAQHMAGEFINRFLMERPPLPAIALTTDPSVITSISNDYSFNEVFQKQVLGLGQRGDVLLVISTSGASQNCILAAKSAREMGIYIIGLLGRDGGKLLHEVDLALVVKSNSTPRVQEVHAFIIHMICELVERAMYGGRE